MKRVMALVLALIMTLSFAACGRIIDGSRDDELQKNDKLDKDPKTKTPGNDAPAPKIDKAFIGLWHAMNMVGSGFAERYAFNEDGTFIYGANQMDDENRQLYASGTWGVLNGELKLETTEKLVISEEDIDKVEKKIISPPKVQTCSIEETGPDPETERATISIDGVTFYNFDNQPDMFDGYYYLTKSGDSASP